MGKMVFNIVVHAVLITFLMGCLISCQPDNPEAKYRPLVEAYLSYWNTGDMAGVENVLHPDFEIRYSPSFEPVVQGIEAFKMEMAENRKVKFSVKLQEVVYSPDALMVRWTAEQYYPDSTGSLTVPVSGKGISLVHLKDGKVLDEWICFDRESWMEQLGYEMVKKESSLSGE